jgi:hypothetical protein
MPGSTNAYAKPDGVFGAAQELLPERNGSGGIEIHPWKATGHLREKRTFFPAEALSLATKKGRMT